MNDSAVLFTAAQAAAWAAGELAGDAGIRVSGVCIDSRNCSDGTMFVALTGERTDGHNFIKQALGSGACVVIVQRGRWESELKPAFNPAGGAAFIIVENTLEALHKIAAGYMAGITRPLRIGITGSSGKTTTKELVAAVLKSKGSVVMTEGNLNSEIGLPLSVFRIKDSHDYAVIEMGINRVGEMDVLTGILRPDVVVITNIGTAHIGLIGSQENIAREKRLAAGRFDGGQTLFVHEDEPYLGFLSEGLKGRLVRYGKKSLEEQLHAPVLAEDLGFGGWKLQFGSLTAVLPLMGRHNLENALCAVAVGLHAGLDIEEAVSALPDAKPLSGRGEIIDGGVRIIQDCYNANLGSMTSAIASADSVEWNGKRHYVLGDMKELGESCRDIHERLGGIAAASRADYLYFFGKDSSAAAEAASLSRPGVFWTDEIDALTERLESQLLRGDLVLLKASRSMELERLVGPLSGLFSGENEC